MSEVVETEINQRWMLRLPPHRACRPEWKTGWEAERLASMHANLEPGMHLIDVGTEEGDLSGLFASWGCAVTLIEPNPKVWPNARLIWEANGLAPPRAYFVGFASDEDKGGELMTAWPHCAYGPVIGDHGFRTLGEWPDMPRIRIDTIASTVGKPDGVTLDVEGAELLVLRGAAATLRDHRPLVWVSVHPTFMADTFGHRVTDLWDHLRACGYEWRLLDYDHELHVIAWHHDGPKPVLPWD